MLVLSKPPENPARVMPELVKIGVISGCMTVVIMYLVRLNWGRMPWQPKIYANAEDAMRAAYQRYVIPYPYRSLQLNKGYSKRRGHWLQFRGQDTQFKTKRYYYIIK